MEKQWFNNYADVATTDARKTALAIANAGYDAINTEQVILNSVKLENNILTVLGNSFDLTKFSKIKVVGFGKASCTAAQALEKVLGNKINEGAVIGLHKVTCDYIQTYAGTHPRPTDANIEPGKKIFDIVDQSGADDLVIAIVSGGGSALLCYPESECDQSSYLYDNFIKKGKTTMEMNTVRKHLSLLKGGGLAKIAYPATVIGLVFSDVPGDHFDDVASGPTYKDNTTIADAQKIIDTEKLGTYELVETPKDNIYFEKVFNFVLVSNTTAVNAMAEKAKSMGLTTEIVSTELYDETNIALGKIFDKQKTTGAQVVLAAGEPNLEVKHTGGSGGRNLYMALQSVDMGLIQPGMVFLPLASDGMDNSDAAGAVVDMQTIDNLKTHAVDIKNCLDKDDVYPAFSASGDMLLTGATGANVSDLMVLYTEK